MNALNRNLRRGERLVLKNHPGRIFTVGWGSGTRKTPGGVSLWGSFEDSPYQLVGPLDASRIIDVEATNALEEKNVSQS